MGVLFLLIFIPWLKGCFHPKPKEIITFVDLAAMPPPPQEIETEPEPSIPEPAPKPVPKPKPTPKPAITNTPPKKVETNAPPKKVEPKPEKKPVEAKKPAPKPKTLAERLAEVRKGGKPVTKPVIKSSPQLDFSGIKSALNSASAGSSSGSSSGSGSGSAGGMYSPFAGYYDSVKRQMYSVWQQPAGAPIGLSATATIQIERNGTVIAKSITRRSGNAPFDQSVQSALNATVHLPVPPADLPSRNIEVEFVLSQ